MEKLAFDNSKMIEELKAGDKIDIFVLVKNYDVKETTVGKQYVDLTIVDKTGEINGKIWENAADNKEILDANGIIKVRGEVLEWNGSLQLKIFKIRGLTDKEDVKMSQLVPQAPIESVDMYDEILGFIDKIRDLQIRQLIRNIVEDKKEKLLFYPAAKKNHHSYRGGLLYHVLRMLRTGEAISTVYEDINTDYIFAGVIIHDICKIDEMDSDEFGVVSDYSMEGKLLGHIIQGIKYIELEGEKIGVDREKIIVLQHLILSHHYEPEYGSPKKPMTLEAEILHYLDIIDARVYDFTNALKNVEPGEFSNKVWVLDNRNVYKMTE